MNFTTAILAPTIGLVCVAAQAGTPTVTKVFDGQYSLVINGNFTIKGITNMAIPFSPVDTTMTAMLLEQEMEQRWMDQEKVELQNVINDASTENIISACWPSVESILASQNTKDRGYFVIAPWSGNYALTVNLKGDLGGVHNYVYIDQGPLNYSRTTIFDGQFSSDTTMVFNIALVKDGTYYVTVGLGSGSVLLHTAGNLSDLSFKDINHPQALNYTNMAVGTATGKLSTLPFGLNTIQATAGIKAIVPAAVRSYSNVTTTYISGASAFVNVSPWDDYYYCANLDYSYILRRMQGILVSGANQVNSNTYTAVVRRDPDEVTNIYCNQR